MAFVGTRVVTLLNFDDTLSVQEDLHQFPARAIDLRDVKRVSLLCDAGSLKELAQRLRGKAREGITFLGRGDYHYVSYLLVRQINVPFTLVLFDNHADLGGPLSFPALTCGSWLAAALRLPHLRLAVIVGASPVSLLGANPAWVRKIVYLPYAPVPVSQVRRAPHELRELLLRFPPITASGMAKAVERLIALIPTPVVYISIDKDVLDKEAADTNWEQGQMPLDDLLVALQALSRARTVCGMDVCGEPYLRPQDLLRPTWQQKVEKNTRANVEIVQTVFQTQPEKNAS